MRWAEKIGMGTDGQDEIDKMPDARCKIADQMDGHDEIKKWNGRWKPEDGTWCQPSTDPQKLVSMSKIIMPIPLVLTDRFGQDWNMKAALRQNRQYMPGIPLSRNARWPPL